MLELVLISTIAGVCSLNNTSCPLPLSGILIAHHSHTDSFCGNHRSQGDAIEGARSMTADRTETKQVSSPVLEFQLEGSNTTADRTEWLALLAA